jgi:cell division protein FtsI (penicillin-binding protein 3)
MVEHAGGAVAAPIFRRVAQMSLKYLGLSPKAGERADLSTLAQKPDRANLTYELIRRAQGKQPPVQEIVQSGPVASGKVRIPDMTGWPVREAVRRAVELGVRPSVQGSGLLARQNPRPGEVVEKGGDLVLVFEPAT